MPAAMVNEIDRLAQAYPQMGYTRQQFIESAVREKIQTLWSIKPKGSKRGFECTYCGQVMYRGKLDTVQEITSAARAVAAHNCPAKQPRDVES